MSVLYLGEDEVRDLIDMEESIEILEQVFANLGTGTTQNASRVRVQGEGVMLHTMSAAADYLGYAFGRPTSLPKKDRNSTSHCTINAKDAWSPSLRPTTGGRCTAGATSGVSAL